MGSAPDRPDVGMRRVTCVRIVLGGPSVRAEVVGTADRLPVVRPVPLRVASALIAAGTPSVFRRQG